MKIKRYEEYEVLFQNYNLAKLITLEEYPKRKNKISNDYSVYLITKAFLADYGIKLFGQTTLRHVNGNDTNIKVYYCFVDVLNIPVENFNIFKQMYAFEDVKVDISLKTCEEFNHSFDYYTKDGRCDLKKNVYCTTEILKSFDSCEDMIMYYRANHV